VTRRPRDEDKRLVFVAHARAAAERLARESRQTFSTRPDKNGWRLAGMISLRDAESSDVSRASFRPERRPAVEDSHHNKNQEALRSYGTRNGS
jgi:hypothetical protein